MSGVRVVDGLKVGFVESASYFKGFHTPSMASTARELGADVVLLMAEGKTGDDLSDEEISALLTAMAPPPPEAGAEG